MKFDQHNKGIEMNTFEVGKTYTTRSVCDHECIISVFIEKRTAKTVTTIIHGEEKVFRIGKYAGSELIKPWGSYSMAPIISAQGDNHEQSN